MDAVHKDYTSTINDLMKVLKEQLKAKETDTAEVREENARQITP